MRYQYGQRTTTPIVRALLSADSAVALERLPPLQVFGSELCPRVKAHVELMRSLGHRYDGYAGYLRRVDRWPAHTKQEIRRLFDFRTRQIVASKPANLSHATRF